MFIISIVLVGKNYTKTISHSQISHSQVNNCDRQLETQNLLALYEEKCIKMKISKNKKMRFFLISQGSMNPKSRFLCQKVCSVARKQTHRHEREYRGHPFKVSRICPSTYHLGSVQFQKSSICKGRPTGFSQPKYHIPM